MEDPTRHYTIPSSAFTISRGYNEYNNNQHNSFHSRVNLVDVNTRGSIFKKRDFYKKSTILLGVLILFMLIVLLVVTTNYVRSRSDLYKARSVCFSDECLRTSANLKLSMNLSIDPCEDFYEFACGRWSKEHPNHGWFAKFSAFDTIDEKITISLIDFLSTNESSAEPRPVKQSRYLYQSCLNTTARYALGYSVVFKYLNELGLPLIPAFFNGTEANDFDWIKMSVNLKKMFAINLFIQFDIDANVFNRSQNIMYVGNGVSSAPLPKPITKRPLPTFSYVFKPPASAKDDDDDEDKKENEELKKRYAQSARNVIAKIVKAVLQNVTDKVDDKIIESAAVIITNVTTDVSTLASANVTDIESIMLKNYTLKELQNLTDAYLTKNNQKPLEIWGPYLKQLFEGSNITFDSNKDLLYISPPEMQYIYDILLYVSKLEKSTLELFHWWAAVHAMIISTTSEISQIVYDEFSPYEIDNPILARPRAVECADLVSGYMGVAVSYGVADRSFINDTKPKVELMLNNIKEAFVERVNNIRWMDNATKNQTLEKSKNMISFIGYPSWLFNKTALEMYYDDIKITPTTYLENLVEIVKTYTPASLKSLHKTNDKGWQTDPITVNAFNYFGENTINVPMAILNFPIYNLGLEALNYGAFGTVLGHELTHGFDNTGRRFDLEGNYKEWWTKSTLKTFENKTKCFVEQYNKFEVPELKDKVDGENTLGENIADNGGLNHAYHAYNKYVSEYGQELILPGFENYTHFQLFFLAYGSLWCENRDLEQLKEQLESDEHSPNHFRVKGSLQNSEDFAQAFKCKKGSAMNPEKDKCVIW